MNTLSRFHYQITGPKAEQITGPQAEPGTDASAAAIPKLVFLHGVMGFAANWRRIARAFEDRYQVLVYDQRGHGRSFQPATGYAPEDYAQDLGAILDELGWQKIYLVGHSMGGRVAYHFASENPERIEKLVIEDIGPAMDPTGSSLVERMLDAVPVPFENKAAAKSFFAHEFLELFKDEKRREGLAQYLYANMAENENNQAVWRFYEAGIRESMAQGRALERWHEIRQLRSPTLLIRGEFSKDLPRETFEKMQAVNSRIVGVEIKDSGHWVHSDQPDQFIKVLDQFFTGQL